MVEGDVDSSSVTAEVLDRLAGVFERHRVGYALLFGSMARGEAGGDYNIAVSAKLTSALELGRLLVEVAEALNVHEDMVDIVLIESAPKHLGHTIISEGRVIYGKAEEAYGDLTRHYLEYLDMNETLNRLVSKGPRIRRTLVEDAR